MKKIKQKIAPKEICLEKKLKLKENATSPPNSSEMRHSFQLWQTGNTDESMRCSHGIVNESVLLFFRPMEMLKPRILFTIQLPTSIHQSILPSFPYLPLVKYIPEQQDIWLERWSLSLRMLWFDCSRFAVVLIPAFFSIVNSALWEFSEQKKNGAVQVFCFSLSSGNRSSGCLTHTHLPTFYTDDIPAQASFYDQAI